MTRTTRSTFVKVLVLTVVLSTSVFAGTKKDSAAPYVTKNAIGTLIAGINSPNDGLKRSSIYFAGKYKVAGAVEDLTKLLKKEDDPATRILIALSLYQIGSTEGMAVVKTSAQEDPDAKVRRMCSAIYETFSMDEVKAFYTVNDNQ